MTTLKIENRKNTTKAGLSALDELINGLAFAHDMGSVASDDFFCRSDVGYNDYCYTDCGHWKIHNGCCTLFVRRSGDDWQEESTAWEALDILRVEQINFKSALSALQIAIKEYNEKCVKKDTEIENFLNFCKEYKK